MGRPALREDLRHKPRSFALDERYMALITVYAEEHDLQRSQALRRLLDLAEEKLDGDVRRLLAERRAEMARGARSRAVPVENTSPACPSCGERDMFVQMQHGRWRCDNCLATGSS